eukprot:3751409-Prymnesium_polylepis.2
MSKASEHCLYSVCRVHPAWYAKKRPVSLRVGAPNTAVHQMIHFYLSSLSCGGWGARRPAPRDASWRLAGRPERLAVDLKHR